MLLTIHNLPAHMQYPDIKQLLFTKCGLMELIVDNLVNEGNAKKVTIGVTHDVDAAIVVRKINGLFLGRQQLYVEDLRNKAEQPFRPQVNPQIASKRLGAPEKHSFGAPNQRRFDAPVSQSYGAPNKQQLGAPKQQLFGAPDNFSAPDNNRFGSPKNQRLGVPENKRLGAPKQQRFNASDNQKFSGPANQRFDDPDSQWFGASMNQMAGASNNKMAVVPDNQQFGVPAVPYAAEQGFLPPGYMQMPMNMPLMPSSSMYIQPTPLMFVPQAQDQNFMGFQPNNPVGWGDNQHQPTGSGLPEPVEEPEPSSYDPHNQDYSTWDKPSIEDEVPMDRGVQRNSSRPRMPENNRSRSPRHGYGGPPNTDYDREYYQRPEDYPAPPNRYYHEEREMEERGRGSNRTDRGPPRGPPMDSRGRVEGSRRDRASRTRQDSTRFDRTETRGDSQRFDDRRSNRFETFDERPRDRPRTENFRPDLKRNAPEPVATFPSKRERKEAELMKDPALWERKLNNREDSYRGMATARIATEVVNQRDITPQQLRALKVAVRKRVDFLLGTNYHDSPEAMIQLYRKRYRRRGDGRLFDSTMEELQRELAAAPPKEPLEFAANGDRLVKVPEGIKQASTKPTADVPSKPAKKPTIPGIPELKKPMLQEGEVLPSYPNASKKVYNQLKTLQKNENEDTYKLDEVTNAVMEEELRAMYETIKQNVPAPKNEAETLAYNFIMKDMSQKYVKALKLLCTKRIQNIHTNLLLRVVGMPKLPNRQAVSQYLKQYNVVSLKASVRGNLYVATLTSFAHYDSLLALDKPTIAGVPVQFKPMHLTGPASKLTKNEYRAAKSNFVKEQLQGYYGAGSQEPAQQGENVQETEPNPNDETFPEDEPLLDEEEPLPDEELFPDEDLFSGEEPDIDDELFDEYDLMNDTVEDIPEDLLNVNEDELEDY